MEKSRGFGGHGSTRVVNKHYGVVAYDDGCQRQNLPAVLDEEIDKHIEYTEENTRRSIDVLHDRVEFFSEFYGKFADTLTSLVDGGLCGVVEDFILPGRRCSLIEGLVCLAHLPLDLIEVHSKS